MRCEAALALNRLGTIGALCVSQILVGFTIDGYRGIASFSSDCIALALLEG